MEQESLLYWMALGLVNGVGRQAYKSLLECFESPSLIFKASFEELMTVPGIGSRTASNIKGFQDWFKVESELKKLEQLEINLITCRDGRYPTNLKTIYDYPPFLYVKGTLTGDDLNIALVGSRMASTYGKFTTEKLARELALNGITVVSGMARGIDSAAHRGAIAGRGRTIAVLGCGLDVVYPPENKSLYDEIVQNGAVISEFALGTPPNAPNFPMRNRIISGLSIGVVVVEANERSGSLITAGIALEQGREVFAVPGNIDTTSSRGTNKLIKEGAKLIENVDDILNEIIPQIEQKKNSMLAKGNENQRKALKTHDRNSLSSSTESLPDLVNLTPSEEIILSILTSKSAAIDDIIKDSGLNVNETLNCLLNLELRNAITQLPGKNYKLKES